MNKNQKIALISGAILLVAAIGGYFFFNKKQEVKTDDCLHGQTEIYEKYKNAVVLVQHTYALQISVKGCKPFTMNTSSYGAEEHTIFGTGFFVSTDGKIVTNHHVAQPWLYDNNNQYSIDYLKEHIANILPDSIATNEIQSFLEKNWENYNEVETGEEVLDEESTDVDSAATEISEATATTIEENIPDFKAVSLDDIEIKPISKSISVALHGTSDRWLECTTIEVSEEEDVDIGVLQLSSKTLPKEVTAYVDLTTAISDDNTLKPGSKAILIGYPMGMTLANTRRGIKVQVYEGQINKETDGVSIQYNITSTHGASGSPVFNECGQLIAVNYAGYDEAQGYNFGIVAKYAIDMAGN